MQENALHGWRLVPDKGHMRMSGYPSKTRSLSWSGDGKWLATSGAEAAIIWPFESKEGPDGQGAARMRRAPRQGQRVAFHPNAYVLAVGYEDGCILLIRLNDASELLVRPAVKDSGITALGLGQGRQAPRLRLRGRPGRHPDASDLRSRWRSWGLHARPFGLPKPDGRASTG